MARNSTNFFSRILNTLKPRRIFRYIPVKTYLFETKRHHARMVAFVVLGACTGVLIAGTVLPHRISVLNNVNVFEEATTTTTTTEVVDAYVLERSKPLSISIPKIYLEAEFEAPLGLKEDKSIEVPESFEDVGWYKYSPTPGELGPSVVLGHVDSLEGAAVFYLIGQLEAGDPIYITRYDGSVAEFEVTGIGRYEQEGFPNDLVYGDIDHAGLRLVTCSGTFDYLNQKYSHNTVVYARLVEPDDGEE